MTQQRQAELEKCGLKRTHTGTGLAGERIWWKRTDTEMFLCRQRDEATKWQDLGEGHPKLPKNTPAANRRWAVELYRDEFAEWHEASPQ